MKMPAPVDCNSPAHWDGSLLYLFNSAPHPVVSSGADALNLGKPVEAAFDNTMSGARWIEATHKVPNGPLYGWYHNEPHPVCSHPSLTAPRIGAAVSTDNGAHWRDLGLIIEGAADQFVCDTANKYFVGGTGDFCVNVDPGTRYVYVFFSTYDRIVDQQGVAVARVPYADRDQPTGKVRKWRDGKWTEPGLGGPATPIFRAGTDWHKPDADAFWGPSVHWNTHLRRWVMLLNRAQDKNWKQEGVYVSFNRKLDDPTDWSRPVKILDGSEARAGGGNGWYPQVLGLDAARHETDKLAGQVARLFVAGVSEWECVFEAQ